MPRPYRIEGYAITDHTFGGWTVVIGLSVLAIIWARYLRAVQRSQLKLT